MFSNFLLLTAVAIGLIALSYSYPSGAPQETCRIFTANHTGHGPQNSATAKYRISVDPSSVRPGGKTTVTIQGTGNEVFKGFFIEGQDESSRQPYGKFKSKAGFAQTRDCTRTSNAATHVNDNNKSKIELEWTAPASFNGNIVFRAVVVKTFETFWDNLYSNRLTVA